MLLKRLGNKERILELFENIPGTFLHAMEMKQIHAEDDQLRSLVAELLNVVVQEMPKLEEALYHQHEPKDPKFSKACASYNGA